MCKDAQPNRLDRSRIRGFVVLPALLLLISGCQSSSPQRASRGEQHARWQQQETAFARLRDATPAWATDAGAPASASAQQASGSARVRATWSAPSSPGSAVAAAARQLGLEPEVPRKFSAQDAASVPAALRTVPRGGYVQSPPTELVRGRTSRNLIGNEADSIQFLSRCDAVTPAGASLHFAFQRFQRLPGPPFGRVETLIDTATQLREGEAFVLWTRSGSLRPNDSNDVLLMVQVEAVRPSPPAPHGEGNRADSRVAPINARRSSSPATPAAAKARPVARTREQVLRPR